MLKLILIGSLFLSSTTIFAQDRAKYLRLENNTLTNPGEIITSYHLILCKTINGEDGLPSLVNGRQYCIALRKCQPDEDAYITSAKSIILSNGSTGAVTFGPVCSK